MVYQVQANMRILSYFCFSTFYETFFAGKNGHSGSLYVSILCVWNDIVRILVLVFLHRKFKTARKRRNGA